MNSPHWSHWVCSQKPQVLLELHTKPHLYKGQQDLDISGTYTGNTQNRLFCIVFFFIYADITKAKVKFEDEFPWMECSQLVHMEGKRSTSKNPV